MEYEIINYLNSKIYKIKIDDLDNDLLIKELDDNMDYISLTHNCDLIANRDVRNMYMKIYDRVEKTLKDDLKREFKGYQSGWVFKCPPKDYTGDYHNHLTLSNKYSEINSDYAWVYYLKIPNNCINREGHLIFKKNFDMDESESISFMPENNYIYVFPATLPHRGEISPNSTIDRYVVVGNIALKYID